MKRNQTILKLPFKEKWFVLWGGDTKELNHHHNVSNQRYAFDFVIVDENNKTHRGEGKNNEDYYAFNKEILAPAGGIVVEIVDGVKDNEIGSTNVDLITGNAVLIEHKEDKVSVLSHLKQGSIRVKVGDKVKTGQIIGLCGNSGNSTEPHLHYHLQDGKNIYEGEGIKCYFQNIRLKRNHKEESRIECSPVMDDIISSG